MKTVRTPAISCFEMWCICMTWLICLSGCKEKETKPEPLFVNYTPITVLEEPDSNNCYAVVEIPAGTVALQHIDTGGIVRLHSEIPIDFIPFPGNYGFIAGSGRFDSIANQRIPLPVLVLMQALTTGSVLEVKPVATLLLGKADRTFPIVVAVPADTALQSIRVTSFVDFITDYDAARHILQQWFLNYRGREMFDFTRWQDEYYTRQLIAEWKRKE